MNYQITSVHTSTIHKHPLYILTYLFTIKSPIIVSDQLPTLTRMFKKICKKMTGQNLIPESAKEGIKEKHKAIDRR